MTLEVILSSKRRKLVCQVHIHICGDQKSRLDWHSPMHRRRRWHPTRVLLPGKSHGRRSLEAAVHGVAEDRTWLSDFTFTFHFHALEKEMATHPRVLAWRIPGTGEPGGLLSMGLHRVGNDWSDLAVAVYNGGLLPALRGAAIPMPPKWTNRNLASQHRGHFRNDSRSTWLHEQINGQ